MRSFAYAIMLLLILSCTNKNHTSYFEGDYLIKSIKFTEGCKDKIIDFLSPMNLEDDSTKITDIYQLFVSIDTTIYEKEKLNSELFIGLIFNSDTSNYEILACNPITGVINKTYLIDDNSTLLISEFFSFWNNFKLIENIDCIEVKDSIKYAEIPESQIHYWNIAGTSSINGKWIPDTVNQATFKDKELNNIWNIEGSLEIKDLKLMNSNKDIINTEKCDFEGANIILKNKKEHYLILCMTNKAIFLYDRHNELLHRLNRLK